MTACDQHETHVQMLFLRQEIGERATERAARKILAELPREAYLWWMDDQSREDSIPVDALKAVVDYFKRRR